MATPKRKRTTTRSKANKRPKYTDSSSQGSTTADYWEAESILGERRVRGKLQYLIQWKGIDPSTGDTYVPTWEPQENPTPDLVAAWQETRAATSASTAAGPTKPTGRPKRTSRPRPARKARVVESSPEPSTAHTTSALSRPPTPADESNILPSSPVATTPVDAPSAKRPSPKIQVGRRRNSFDADEFEPFSQLSASQPASVAPADSQASELVSSQLFAARPEYQSSGIVPDSQSTAGEDSFVPATQQTTRSTQQSSAGDESQGDLTQDSGLLEIVGQAAASRAPSPARSIPETIYDTTADSQSQRRLVSQDHVEISSASEATQKTSQANTESESQPAPQVSTYIDDQSQVEPTSLEHPAPPSPAQVASQVPEAVPFGDSAQQPLEDQDQSRGDCEETTVPVSLSRGASESGVEAAEDDQGKEHHAEATGRISVGRNQSPSTEQQVGSVAQESQSGAPQREQSASQDIAEASRAEHSVPALDDAAQAPDLPHHPQHDHSDVAQASTIQITPGTLDEPSTTDVPSVNNERASAQPDSAGAIPTQTSVTNPVQASPKNSTNNAPQASEPLQAELSLASSTQTEDELLFSQFIEPEYIRGRSPARAQPTVVEDDTVGQSTCGTVEEAVLRRDFAVDSQTSQSTASRDQNAQVVPQQQDLSTQEYSTESIRPSVEVEDRAEPSTPDSRHDSSQDTPERRKRSSSAYTSSPIAQPPSHSLPTLDSNIPPRPSSPIPTSSISIMASQGTEADVRRQVQEVLAKAVENAPPFTPTRRLRRSIMSHTPSATTPAIANTPNDANPNSNRQSVGASASPIVASDGTRSPSTIPDRSPALSAPTSLRTIALTRATQGPTETFHEADKADPKEALAREVSAAVPTIVTTETTVPEEPSDDDDIMSDASDGDTESLLNDDLQLDAEEYIVPLFMDGRQGDEYTRMIKHEKDLLLAFAKDRDGFEPFAKIEMHLSKSRALETHIDLLFEEASSSSIRLDGASQLQWQRQFGKDNSAKFMFLHTLFHAATDEEKHIVLVIEKEDDSLLDIIETFCKACYVQYNIPTKDRRSSPEWVKGNLRVTILPGTVSPIIRPPDVIICLDGVQDAKVIRQKNWARHPELEFVPVLHLVISRTVGHIERYLSASLNERERAHTIVASLGNMISQLGKPIDEDMPRAPATAAQVAAWLGADEYPRDWPLGSIGSVKDVIEFQTQTSEASPVAERTKRPHEEEETLDPAKRMRLTPQPQAAPSSSTNHDNDITRISDSMPSTATNMASLHTRVARLEEALQQEKKRHREQEIAWDKQQTVHENLTLEHRELLAKYQNTEESLKSLTKDTDTLRERLTTRTMELRARDEELKEQRQTNSLSEDAKTAEITKLRVQLAQAVADKERAAKSAKSAEATLDYSKEQYRLAQEAATTSTARVSELETQMAKLSHVASGQPAALKKLHLDRQHDTQAKQIKSLKAENSILKKSVQQKDEELQRARMSVGRQGVGTRATSATPQPNKVRSRAASPANRLSNLRNG